MRMRLSPICLKFSTPNVSTRTKAARFTFEVTISTYSVVEACTDSIETSRSNLPPSMTPMVSATCSISPSKWLEMSNAIPQSSRSRRNNWRIS
ncbi:hypothetical protein D3C81_1090920 [compost metagenome]